MYSFGTLPPVTSFSNTNPLPEGSGSTRILTWPYCPCGCHDPIRRRIVFQVALRRYRKSDFSLGVGRMSSWRSGSKQSRTDPRLPAHRAPGRRRLRRSLEGGGPGGLLKAIKFVFGDLAQHAGEDGQRAEQELKALSRVKTVRHPYILSLERYDIIDGQLIIVMELADRNLWDRFKECRAKGLPGIPREELLGYMEETAEALDLMNNEYQLQHLDIKPQNLFLVHNHVKVADFGLVKDLEGMAGVGHRRRHAGLRRPGNLRRLGQPLQRPVQPGHRLPGTAHRAAAVHRQQRPPADPAAPCRRRPTYRAAAGDRPVIARALAKKPDERHGSLHGPGQGT